MMPIDLPDKITSEEQLDEVMSLGSPDLIRMLKEISGDIVILGCAGKIGVPLAMTAVKAVAKAGGKTESSVCRAFRMKVSEKKWNPLAPIPSNAIF